jgi:hypothetical protein
MPHAMYLTASLEQRAYALEAVRNAEDSPSDRQFTSHCVRITRNKQGPVAKSHLTMREPVPL